MLRTRFKFCSHFDNDRRNGADPPLPAASLPLIPRIVCVAIIASAINGTLSERRAREEMLNANRQRPAGNALQIANLPAFAMRTIPFGRPIHNRDNGASPNPEWLINFQKIVAFRKRIGYALKSVRAFVSLSDCRLTA